MVRKLEDFILRLTYGTGGFSAESSNLLHVLAPNMRTQLAWRLGGLRALAVVKVLDNGGLN